MKNDYWKNRFIALEESRNKNSKQTYNQIAPAFDKAERQIQNQIDMWYQRFADNNGVSLQAARKLLTGDELKELKWDIQEYIKYGKENAFTAEWMTELENASAKYHISRLEALKLRTQQSLEVAFGNELDAVDGMLRHQFGDTYHHTCFEIMRGYNVGWDIGQIDERRLSTILSNPWASDGKTFSDRIWQSKRQMVNDLHQQMTRACILGKAPDETIRSLTKYLKDKTKNARYQAGRLVMTESTWIGSVAQEHAFNDLDVEEFEVVATLDSHTSDICQDMDGQHYPMKLYEVGVTAPPFHCFCRSCTAPYFNDEFSLGERAARDADGKTYYVPSDMTYKAWKNSFVDGGDKGALIPVNKVDLTPVVETVDDEMTWTPRMTSSMIRNPADFRKTKKFTATTIEEANNIGSGILTQAYENNRIAENLTLTPLKEMVDDDYFMKCVSYGGKCSVETANTFNETFEDLTQRYNTTLNRVRIMTKDEYVGHSNSFAFVYHDYSVNNSTMVLNSSKINDYNKLTERISELSGGHCINVIPGKEGRYVVTHEFAHTLISMEDKLLNSRNWSGMDFAKIKKARKEIKKVYDSYMDELKPLADARQKAEETVFEAMINGVDSSEMEKLEGIFNELDDKYNAIRISEYSLVSADEFLAEAFTDVEIGQNPSKYSTEVHNILTKYFGR